MESRLATRRRSCIRPSVSPVNSEPKHFLKVILSSAIHGKKMRIPQEFIRRFGNQLSTETTINVPDGLHWKMELKRSGDEVWFCNGWQEFQKYYSISYGSLLMFTYESSSNFHVHIFDMTAAEIYYPSDHDTRSKRRTQEDQEEIIDVDNMNSRKKLMYKSREKNDKNPGNQNPSRGMSNSSSKREFKPENPSFTAKINDKSAYIPSAFAARYLSIEDSIKLQNSNGRQWEVHCSSHHIQSKAMRITKGWCIFRKDNHLVEGDVCTFELIKTKQVVLKVTA